MALPAPTASWADLKTNSAVLLFVQSAQHADASFVLTSDNIESVVQVCQLVDGMPLGIELAAAWIRTISCSEIVSEIQNSLDLFTTSKRNISARHRSIRTIFEQTWQRLSDDEQEVLRKLSVFRGGCVREAAEQVADATLPLLASLIDKALLRHSQSGRYEIHELIRQFAEEQLLKKTRGDQQAQDHIQDQHCTYYAAFLQKQTADLKGGRQREALDEIAADIDNVRTAWNWAVEQQHIQALEQSIESLWHYSDRRGAIYEIAAAFRHASTSLKSKETVAEGTIGFLLAGQGWFHVREGLLTEGQALLEQGVELLRRVTPVDGQKEAFALIYLSFAYFVQGQYATAITLAEECLALCPKIDDRWIEAACLHELGQSAEEQGRFAEAKHYLEACSTLCEEIGDVYWRNYADGCLIYVAVAEGDFTRAEDIMEQALQKGRTLDDPMRRAFLRRTQCNLLMAQGKYSQAIEAAEESQRLFDEIGSHWYASVTLGFVGTAYRLQGFYEKAEQLTQESLAVSQAIGNPRYITVCLKNLGALAYALDLHREAEAYYREALDVCEQAGNEFERAVVSCQIGHVLAVSDISRHDEVRELYKQSLEFAVKHNLAPIALDVFVGLSKLLAPSEQIQKAVELLLFVEGHFASTHETKENARHYLDKLMTELSAESLASANDQIQTLDWRDVAKQLVKDL